MLVGILVKIKHNRSKSQKSNHLLLNFFYITNFSYRFWFLFVAISTIINFLYCVMAMVPPSAREKSVRQWLKQESFQEITDSEHSASILERFSNLALRAGKLF